MAGVVVVVFVVMGGAISPDVKGGMNGVTGVDGAEIADDADPVNKTIRSLKSK